MRTYQQIEDDLTQATQELVKLNATIWSFPDNGGTVVQVQLRFIPHCFRGTNVGLKATWIAEGMNFDRHKVDDITDLENAALSIIGHFLDGLLAKKSAFEAVGHNTTALIIQGLESARNTNQGLYIEWLNTVTDRCQRQVLSGNIGGLIEQGIDRVTRSYEGLVFNRDLRPTNTLRHLRNIAFERPSIVSRTVAQVETDLELVNSQIHVMNDSVWLFPENANRANAMNIHNQAKNMAAALNQTTAEIEEALGPDVAPVTIQDLQSIKPLFGALGDALAAKMPNRCWAGDMSGYYGAVMSQIDTVIAAYEQNTQAVQEAISDYARLYAHSAAESSDIINRRSVTVE
ncbi:hypothetical protein C8J57DRAFT_1238226 [Mycena rebaudengoi]|nr:hypothetical protein C8J57DRAFT_1238226 [Mycena rebaudengoi]